jgi:hypothetical protein
MTKNKELNYQYLEKFSNQDLIKELQTRIKKKQVLISELGNLPNNIQEVSNLTFLKELNKRVKEGDLFFVNVGQAQKIINE